MINIYNIYSTNIINEHYAIWKLVLRIKHFSSILQQEIIIEHQFATIIDLLSQLDDNLSGQFNSIEEYKSFLEKDLDNIAINPPDNFYFAGYPLNIDSSEIDFFITKNKKQKGYLIPKVYNNSNNKQLPAFYVVLIDYWYSVEETFTKLCYPENKDEQNSLLYENQFNRFINMYERDGILNFDFPYNLLYSEIQNIIIEYLTKHIVSIEKYNEILDKLNGIRDIGVKKYLHYILITFADYLKMLENIASCDNCGKLFVPSRNKKYCSQSCKIKLKNMRYYKKNSKKLKLNRSNYHQGA